VQTIKDMDTPKITGISDRNVSNEQVNTWQTNVTEKKDLVMSDVSSVVEIILRVTRAYKRKHTHLSVWKYTLRHKSNKPYTLNQE
jgi:hypothetical protein